jgi:hypothetical protein
VHLSVCMKIALLGHPSLASVALALLLSVAGCAAPTQTDDADGSSEAAVTVGSEQRKAVLNGLRARVAKDFERVASLEDKKLVFVVSYIETDGDRSSPRTGSAEARRPRRTSSRTTHHPLITRARTKGGGERITADAAGQAAYTQRHDA